VRNERCNVHGMQRRVRSRRVRRVRAVVDAVLRRASPDLHERRNVGRSHELPGEPDVLRK
jgi:hypothetical protein